MKMQIGKGEAAGMKKCVIVSGGTATETFVAQTLKEQKPDFVIAADSGMEVLRKCAVKPDIIIGDFDSVREETFAYYKEQPGIVWHTLNPMKDDTDTEFAIRLAIREGAEQICLLGATGSRLDHVLGNIELLGIGFEQKVAMELLDEHNRVRMIDGPIQIAKKEQYGKYVSLIPYSPQVEHLTLEGFVYPLSDFCLKGFCSLGVSNEITEEIAKITFEDGILIVIESRD